MHFSGFRYKWFCSSILSTSLTIRRCSSTVSVNTRISSMYTITCPSSICRFRMWFMNDWKVAGELVSPKNITVGSNRPRFVRNAAFHSSPSLIRILLYPHRMSIFEKTWAFFSLSMSSWISGSGYRFLTVISLSFR